MSNPPSPSGVQTLKDTMAAVYLDFKSRHASYYNEAFLQSFNTKFGVTDPTLDR